MAHLYIINTSYFAKSAKLENTVSIARQTPNFYKSTVFKAVAPTWEILNEFHNSGDEVLFEKRYRDEILSKLDAEVIAEALNGNTVLCYEASSKFCHRHLLIKWLKEKLGEDNIESREL